jgi:hypothetical protein
MNRKQTKPRILRYEEIRDQIKNGDVLMYKGRGLISSIIQWATRSPYSHAGIAARWNERLMVLEAKGRGVVASPFSRNVKEYRGDVEWFSCIREISEEGRLNMVIFAQEELGKHYGRLKTIWLGLRTLFERDMEKRDRLKKESKLFCSEYVAQIYNSIGMDLKKQRSDRFMRPGDIAESPLLERKGILKLQSK